MVKISLHGIVKVYHWNVRFGPKADVHILHKSEFVNWLPNILIDITIDFNYSMFVHHPLQ